MTTPSKNDSFFVSPHSETYPILVDHRPEDPPHLLQLPYYWKWPARIIAFHRNQHGITDVRKKLNNFHQVWLFTNSLQATVLADG
jgi:hypothetical protein